MKKCLLCLIGLLFFVQPKVSAQFEYGITTGLNIGYAVLKFRRILPSGELGKNSHWKRIARNWPSPILGVYAEMEVNRHFSLRTELVGIHKTWRSDRNFAVNLEQFEFTYLSLPILVVFRPRQWGLELGPELNRIIVSRNISPSKLVMLEPQRLELGLAMGAKYYRKKWSFGVRFSQDLTPFFRNNHKRSINFDSRFANYYHRGLQFNTAYAIR